MTRRRIFLGAITLCLSGALVAPVVASAAPRPMHNVCVVFPTDPSNADNADGYCVWVPVLNA